MHYLIRKMNASAIRKARPGSKIEAYIDGNLVGETTTENDGF